MAFYGCKITPTDVQQVNQDFRESLRFQPPEKRPTLRFFAPGTGPLASRDVRIKRRYIFAAPRPVEGRQRSPFEPQPKGRCDEQREHKAPEASETVGARSTQGHAGIPARLGGLAGRARPRSLRAH